jgi:lipoprotein-anchoring transpeptidase ErfK/SrfK
LRSRLFIAVAAVVAGLAALSGATLVYDHGRRDTIAEGVTVGGVDVGGLSRTQAAARLRRAILEPLRRPVTVDHGTRTWRLTATEAQVATNLDATVDQALARSRTGNVVQRAWRGLTGGRVDAHLQPAVTFSDRSIVRLLDRVRAHVDRQAKDAKMDFGPGGPQLTPGQEGLAVDAGGLHRRIRAALASPTAPRRFSAVTHHVQPAVTSRDLQTKWDTALVLNRGAFRLTLFKHLKLLKTYNVAVGAVGLETPAGLYHIQNKAVDPAWTKPNSDWVPKAERGTVVPGGVPENPLKARWLGIFDGAGIHGIDPSEYGTIGHAASHGCVRMRIPDVEDLYPRVPVGAPIYIA